MPLMVLFVVGLLLALYCLVDLLPRSEDELAGLPKVGWIVVILVFLVVGSLAYLMLGRAAGSTRSMPSVGSRSAPGARRTGSRPVARGPEDDEEFQAQLRRRVAEQRRRAEEQRRKGEQA